MKQHRPEVADVFRSQGKAFLDAWGRSASRQQRKALRDICACRTAALGGHVLECGSCGHQEISYNSCRNRHCPKCQALARARWLEDREAELLEASYFHVVFTLPDELAPLALQNPRAIYGLLFRAASRTLSQIARDPRHLGAKIGFLAVLHTWGQRLDLHPHLHCLVPGGGISPDGSRWIPCRKGFFLPVKVLSRRFRNLFLRMLGKAFDKRELSFHGKLSHLARQERWQEFLRPLRQREWVVYAKPPFQSPRRVLKYLARYTHRVAFSNRRLLRFDPARGRVAFLCKDYRTGKRRTLTLDAAEFIRRFLLHVLPGGFMQIRHYGFLANCVRGKKLPLCRRLLGQPAPGPEDRPSNPAEQQPQQCPACGKGILCAAAALPAEAQPRHGPDYLLKLDSS